MLVDMECPRFHSRLMISSAINVLFQMLSLRLVWVTDKILLGAIAGVVAGSLRLCAKPHPAWGFLRLAVHDNTAAKKEGCTQLCENCVHPWMKPNVGRFTHQSNLMDEAMLSRYSWVKPAALIE